ncbi:MAG: rhamnogalacturonan lyase [Thermogutta sp.]|nr:rhamnogalacturonan lyase [Thermogutta sp.]
MFRHVLTGLRGLIPGSFWSLPFAAILTGLPSLSVLGDQPVRLMERLDRGVVAITRPDGTIAISWRLLGTDSPRTQFHVYREGGDEVPVRLTEQALDQAAFFVDAAPPSKESRYVVEAWSGGNAIERSPPIAPSPAPYLEIPLQTLPGHSPNDASVGDLDGDGKYEIILKQEMRPRDNSQRGPTGQTKLEAYTLTGRFLWRIDLGPNVREGAHYTPFVVYDLDGDGSAEVVCRTADGTIDGGGKTLGNPTADHRNSQGLILTGPEFLTVFSGRTGEALASEPYVPPRGDVRDWGDDYGNRSDRFLACVAYPDGRHPSVVMARGYYTRTVLAAWDWRNGRLRLRWVFDSDAREAPHPEFRGQGNHNLAVADVDGDGRDEIIYGACAIDDTGEPLYSTGLGHGDALHVTDIDPDRPGLEVFAVHERPPHLHACNLRDAATGRVLWGLPGRDGVRGLASDIDPRYRGLECWAFGAGLSGLFDCRGRRIAERSPPSCNMAVWWDGDLLRELLDRTRIEKWLPEREICELLLDAAECGCVSINGTKGNPSLVADIMGDWREEVLWPTRDGKWLLLFTSPIPTTHRFVTLMHDPVYRLAVAWQNVGYNQPPHPGFFLGEGMAPPPPPRIEVARPSTPSKPE